MPIDQTRPTTWPQVVGFFLIPTFFALVQGWAVHRIGMHIEVGPLGDEATYTAQARLFQDEPVTLERILGFGLYPAFLSQFELRLGDLPLTNDPKLLFVHAAQSLVLSATSALFLFCAFIFIPGNLIKRIIICVLLGGILLSPKVVMWPNVAMTEVMRLSAILLFACACLGGDARRRWSLVLIAIACCLLVLVHDSMFLFVLPFTALLLANILFTNRNSTRPVMIGAVLMLLAVGIGAAKASLLPPDPQTAQERHLVERSQALRDIILYRILPDTEYRKFFFDRGLPISSTLLKRSFVDEKWGEPDSKVSEYPDIIAFRHWVTTKGTQTYVMFLLTHPSYLAHSIVRSPNVAANSEGEGFPGDFYFSIADLLSIPNPDVAFAATYPRWLWDFLAAPFGWLVPSLYLIAAAICYTWLTATRQQASALDIAAIAAGGAVFATYHADAWVVWRHTVPFIVLIYISLIIRTTDIAIETVHALNRVMHSRFH